MVERVPERLLGMLRRWLRDQPFEAALLGLGVVFCVLRFVGLEYSPPGFFSDEFRGALHQICIGQERSSGYGDRWPGFVIGMGGGLYTPPFLYLGALWVEIFGPSIASCRAFAAMFSLVTIAATTLIARRVAGPREAAFTFVAASLVPWSFHFARIAWDPPLAPAFLLWAVYFWLLRARVVFVVCSAVCFALALYAYPPTRVQAPLVFALLGIWALYQRRLRFREVAVFLPVVILVAWPLIRGTLDGTLTGRGSYEAIWAGHYVDASKGRYSKAMFIVLALFDHFQAHFRPTFLFLTGDFNLRSSTQFFGVFGLLDDLMLGVVAWSAIRRLSRPALGGPTEPRPFWTLTAGRSKLLGFAAPCYLFGVLPAAMCWSGVPHALRSIGAWPFLALLTGVVLGSATEKAGRWFRGAVLGAALLHAAVYLTIYFGKYPAVPGEWFDVSVKAAMLDPKFDATRRLELVRTYPEGFRYYSIAYGGETCRSSNEKLSAWLSNPVAPPLSRASAKAP